MTGVESFGVREEHHINYDDMGTVPAIIERFITENKIDPSTLYIYATRDCRLGEGFSIEYYISLLLKGEVWSRGVDSITGQILDRAERE